MTPTIVTPTGPVVDLSTRGQLPVAERAAYVYIGNGMFRPANDAAWREVERWNAYADAWNARTATRSAP